MNAQTGMDRPSYREGGDPEEKVQAEVVMEASEIQKPFYTQGRRFGIFVENASTLTLIKIPEFL